jgi:hypothetical protein
MTIRIPFRALLVVLYTAAILAGAFGISYAVFEWRDDDDGPDSGPILQATDSPTLETINERLDGLDGSVKNLQGRVDVLSDWRTAWINLGKCHNAIEDLILVLGERVASGGSPALARDAEEALMDFNRYC